ncbi:MAG: hypothetical protein ACREIC_09590 [Limisphaerales bacterium]
MYRCTLHPDHFGKLKVRGFDTTAAITNPQDNATFLAPADVAIEVSATPFVGYVVFSLAGPAGSIESVSTNVPFQLSLTNLAAGDYTCKATPLSFEAAYGDYSLVKFTVTTNTLPAQVSNPVLLPDGRFQFTLSGVIGATYDIQAASTPSGQWQTILNVTATNSNFPFIEPPDQQMRFYRIVTHQ